MARAIRTQGGVFVYVRGWRRRQLGVPPAVYRRRQSPSASTAELSFVSTVKYGSVLHVMAGAQLAAGHLQKRGQLMGAAGPRASARWAASVS